MLTNFKSYEGDRVKKIVIDPGHGGTDPGAVSDDFPGIDEKTYALDISARLRCLLELDGKYKCLMTREKDIFVSVPDRSKMANDWGADLFVSIHHNARFEERPGIEIETFFYIKNSPESKAAKAAREVQSSLIIGLVKDGEKVIDRKVKQANFSVLRETNMPAILVELGFITDRDEATWLGLPMNRALLAELVNQGIRAHFAVRRHGPGGVETED